MSQLQQRQSGCVVIKECFNPHKHINSFQDMAPSKRILKTVTPIREGVQ